jgi:hypothetical protein
VRNRDWKVIVRAVTPCAKPASPSRSTAASAAERRRDARIARREITKCDECPLLSTSLRVLVGCEDDEHAGQTVF